MMLSIDNKQFLPNKILVVGLSSNHGHTGPATWSCHVIKDGFDWYQASFDSLRLHVCD